MNDIITARTPQQVQAVQLLALKGALKLEVKGLRRSRGPSAYSMIKERFGLHGNKASVLEQFINRLEAMGILKPEQGGLVGWLTNTCNAFNVEAVEVIIGQQTWFGARYSQQMEYQQGMDAVVRGDKQAGDKYNIEAIYCVGVLPESYKAHANNRVCYPYDGTDWYVAGYLPAPTDNERMKQYHPFGVNFLLCPWNVPDGQPIDHYEPTPYTRINMEVRKV